MVEVSRVGRRGRKASEKAGLPPGSLVHIGEKSEQTRLSVIQYDARQANAHKDVSASDLSRFQETPGITWLNVTGLEDVAILQRIGQQYQIHSLIMEDVLHTGQRTKAEVFDDCIFLVFKMVRVDGEQADLDIEQVSMILGRDFVITFQEKQGDVFDPVRARLLEGKGRLRSSGPDQLAHAIADVIVDEYFAVLEQLSEMTEVLEGEVLAQGNHDLIGGLHHLKRRLVTIRRCIWPLREELAVLLRDEHPLIAKDTRPYLRDLYDHAIRVIDTVESLRDTTAGLLDAHLSSISNRMNEVMKVLTIISTTFIPLTFIAGVYGMNFEHMPELRIWWAYPLVWGLFVLISLGMIVFFRRKRWL